MTRDIADAEYWVDAAERLVDYAVKFTGADAAFLIEPGRPSAHATQITATTDKHLAVELTTALSHHGAETDPGTWKGRGQGAADVLGAC